MDRKKIIENAVLSITKDELQKYNKSALLFTAKSADKYSQKCLQNAITEYAAGCKSDDIVVFVDQSITSNGKKGFLFTENEFYASRKILLSGPFGKPCIQYPVVYDELESVSLDGDDNTWLILQYKNGDSKRAYGNLHTPHLFTALNEILKALAGEQYISTDNAPSSSASELKDTSEYKPAFAADKTQALLELAAVLNEIQKTRTEEQPDYSKALSWFLAAARQDDMEAAYLCSIMYFNGIGTDIDQDTALKWLKKAAVQGHKASQEAYYKAFEIMDSKSQKQEEPDFEKDSENALHLLRERALQDDAEAQYILGNIYCYGKYGIRQDVNVASYWLEEAESNGYDEAEDFWRKLDISSLNFNKDPENALPLLRKCALHDVAEAQYTLGTIYCYGDYGMPKNVPVGLYWLQEAEFNGYDKAEKFWSKNPQSAFDRALATADKNIKELLHARRKAAGQGHPASQYNYARMLKWGHGTTKSEGEAFHWYEKADKGGHVTAMYMCGKAYEEGSVTDKNMQKSLYWYEKAAESGNGNAQYSLAKLYDHGSSGVKKNPKQALYWYQKAAEQHIDGAKARYDWLSAQADTKKPVTSGCIMICERAPLYRLMLKSILTAYGFSTVYEAESIKESLELYKSQKPVLIFLSLMFDEFDSFESITKTIEKWSDARIILIYRGFLENTVSELMTKYSCIKDAIQLPLSQDIVTAAILKALK